MDLIIQPELAQALQLKNGLFDYMMSLQGAVYRKLEGRCTQRVILNNHPYFIKQHFGVGWKEIFKNLVSCRLPVISAKNEWLAIQRLNQLGVHTPRIVGYGCRGINPAQRQSFLLTEELTNIISLEDLCRDWRRQPPAFALKQALLQEAARIAKTMHENGINHRDFYLCHLLLDKEIFQHDNKIFMYVLDLHRAQIHQRLPTRWVVKDLAGLYFSSKDIGLTQRDLLRFIKCYRGKPLREILQNEKNFWHSIQKQGDILYQQHEQ